MLQVLLTGRRAAREEAVLEAPIGVVVTQEGRARRRQQVLRLPQGDGELGELRLIELASTCTRKWHMYSLYYS